MLVKSVWVKFILKRKILTETFEILTLDIMMTPRSNGQHNEKHRSPGDWFPSANYKQINYWFNSTDTRQKVLGVKWSKGLMKAI